MKAVTPAVRAGADHLIRAPPGRGVTRTLVTWYWACWLGDIRIAVDVARTVGMGGPGRGFGEVPIPQTKPVSRAATPALSSSISPACRLRIPEPGPGSGEVAAVGMRVQNPGCVGLVGVGLVGVGLVGVGLVGVGLVGVGLVGVGLVGVGRSQADAGGAG